ncbi:MAG: hypothetical protein CL678_15690 [Bdellovibrionaceae bacterium]|nr:hypothetical protein [Pseudobdellovibrionaceae bacterium]
MITQFNSTMPENEANKANFEELMGHVTVLKARLESAMTSGTSPQQAQIDDLFDYYERAVSDRVMRNNTLTEELGAAHRAIAHHQRRHQAVVWCTGAAIAAAVLTAIILAFPESISVARSSPAIMYAAAAIVSFALGVGVASVRRPRARGKQD